MIDHEQELLLDLVAKYKVWFHPDFFDFMASGQGMAIYESFSAVATSKWEGYLTYSGGKPPVEPIYAVRKIVEDLRWDRLQEVDKHKLKLVTFWATDYGRLYVIRYPERVRMFKYEDRKKNSKRRNRFLYFHENLLFPKPFEDID